MKTKKILEQLKQNAVRYWVLMGEREISENESEGNRSLEAIDEDIDETMQLAIEYSSMLIGGDE